MTDDETGEHDTAAVASPQLLAADRRSLDERDLPSRTDVLGAALSETIGGPVGRHALIGRQRFLTPLRVMFLMGLVFLALGWSTKAACLQSTSTGTADQRVAIWENDRAYYELCYSDTVPLYTAEMLNLGKFPYKSSWLETDSSGKLRTQYDGRPAVRYMEYPVLTGLYQYASMALAKTYTVLTKVVGIPIVAEVVMFFNVAAFGLALAWLATVWATAMLAGRRIWDAALVAASPVLIFQIFTNFDAVATACAIGSMLAWARRKPVLAGVLLGLGIAAKLYPALLLLPLVLVGVRAGRLREVGQTAAVAAVTWLLVNLPVMVLFPRGWSEFFRLNARRGDDMDSVYNVVKSFTGWSGLDANLGFWHAGRSEQRRRRAVSGLPRRDRLHCADRTAPSAGRAAGVSGGRDLPSDEQGVESAVLAVAGTAGGAGAAASPNSVGVDDNRRPGMDTANVLPVQRP